MKKIILLGIFVAVVVGIILLYQKFAQNSPETPSAPKATKNLDMSVTKTQVEKVTTLVENLDTPWSLAFLPDGTLLVTERNGKLSQVSDSGVRQIATIDKSTEYGEGGLMGLAIHPDFESNNYIYLYYTYFSDDNRTLNRVARYKLANNSLSNETIIVDNIPGGIYHDGGRIKFGPDGFLYITTGDSTNPSLSQDRNSLAGKILRVTEDGSPASGNPFGTRIYSYGHRNPQGITWDGTGVLWETEHGPSGSWPNCCQDELNRIEIGANFGWPDSVGDKVDSGTAAPILHSGRNIWAPGDIAYLNNKLYFAGLRGETLYVYDLSTRNLSEYFKGEFGRLREVIAGPDNLLYITTSNRDGRGDPAEADDRIIRIDPAQL